jgi:hypothetical protein
MSYLTGNVDVSGRDVSGGAGEVGGVSFTGGRGSAGVGVSVGEEHATNNKTTTSITFASIYCTFFIFIFFFSESRILY